ncbi:MAG: DUF4258 domain-containing protein [Rhodoferax sp.]|nr:DUF4258 domain-containing protein [Rhodoferax sp.]
MSNKPLSDAQVATEVRHLVSANRIGWTRHAEERMALRGIDKGQVKECLKKGVFTESPTIPNRSGDIEYTFRIEAIVDHETLIVAASLIPAKKVVVITVFPDK